MFGVEGLGRYFLIGTIIGFIGTFAVFGAITYWATAQVPASVAVGLYTAFWGGPGFGGMLGGAVAMIRDEHQHPVTAVVDPAVIAPVTPVDTFTSVIPSDGRVTSVA